MCLAQESDMKLHFSLLKYIFLPSFEDAGLFEEILFLQVLILEPVLRSAAGDRSTERVTKGERVNESIIRLDSDRRN